VITYLMLVVVLTAAGVQDWRSGRVDNRLSYAAILAGLLLHGVLGFQERGLAGIWPGVSVSLLAMLAGFIPFAVIYAAGGLHGADVKMMAAVGAISASWECVLGTALYAFIFAALMAVAIMIRRGVVRQTFSRIKGALLTAAARAKPELPDDGPRVPFVVAIAAGAALSGVEHLLGHPMPWN